jgi:hypothetical protein
MMKLRWQGHSTKPINADNIRRNIMAKGQIRGNKETKKPKKSKDVVVPSGSIIPMKSSVPPKK